MGKRVVPLSAASPQSKSGYIVQYAVSLCLNSLSIPLSLILICVFSVPGMIDHGLTDCSQYRPRKSVSDDTAHQGIALPLEDYVSLSAMELSSTNLGRAEESQTLLENQELVTQKADMPASETEEGTYKTQASNDMGQHLKPPSHTSPESSESDWETLDPNVLEDPNSRGGEHEPSVTGGHPEILPKELVVSESIPITVQPQPKAGHTVFVPGLVSGLEEDQYGMPLAIFTKVRESPKSYGLFSHQVKRSLRRDTDSKGLAFGQRELQI